MGTLRVENITNEAGSGSPTFPAGLTVTSVTIANTWVVSENTAGELEISVGGSTLFKIDQSGNVFAAGDITAFENL